MLLCLIVVYTSLLLQAKTSRERGLEWVYLDDLSPVPFGVFSYTVMTANQWGWTRPNAICLYDTNP